MTRPLDAPVVEHPLLPVRPGDEPARERAMAAALPLVTEIPGFRGMHVIPEPTRG